MRMSSMNFMKLRYAQDYESQLHRQYSDVFIKWVDTCAAYTLVTKHGFGAKRLSDVFRTQREIMNEKVKAYTPDAQYVKTRRGVIKIGKDDGPVAENDCLVDGCNVAVTNVAKWLESFGFRDPSLEEMTGCILTDEHNPYINRQWRTVRRVWLASGGLRCTKLMSMTLLVALHETAGWSKVRLERFYDEIKDWNIEFYRDYMRGDIYIDNRMVSRTETMRNEMAKRGVGFDHCLDDADCDIHIKTLTATEIRERKNPTKVETVTGKVIPMPTATLDTVRYNIKR